MANILQTLRNRGLLQDVTDPELEDIVEKKSVTMYIGFDPSADSLHVGNFVGIMVLKHFQMHGHRPIPWQIQPMQTSKAHKRKILPGLLSLMLWSQMQYQAAPVPTIYH